MNPLGYDGDNSDMASSRWFFDLDHTLYDTDALVQYIWDDLIAQGYATEDIDATRRALTETGYTFEGHLTLLGMAPEEIAQNTERFRRYVADGNRFLLPGVTPTLTQLAKMDTCNLLTFGNPDFQGAKYAGITHLHPLIQRAHYVWKDHTKGDVLRDAGEGKVFFVDDAVQQLLDAHEKAPWVTLIRMMWPQFHAEPHPEDGTLWRVAQCMEDLDRL